MLRLRTFIIALVAIAALGLVPPSAGAAEKRPCVFNANFTTSTALSTTSITTNFSVMYGLAEGDCFRSRYSFHGTVTGTCYEFYGWGAIDGRAFSIWAAGPVVTLSGAVTGTIQLWQEGPTVPWCSTSQRHYDALGEYVITG